MGPSRYSIALVLALPQLSKFNHHSSSLLLDVVVPDQQLVASTRAISSGEPVQGAARRIMDLRTALSKRLCATTVRRWGIFEQLV